MAPSLAYGYRIQPPFLLVMSQASKQLFLAWDISSHFGVWTDEIGSFLQSSEFVTIRDVLVLVDRLEKDLEVRNVEFCISFVRTTPTREFLNEIEDVLRTRARKVSITTIEPAPYIQATKREGFEDIFVFDDREETDWNGETKDICSGFVIPNSLPGYQITLHFTTHTSNPKQALMEIAENISHLSWLSVKPNAEHRASAYPPHVVAALYLCECPLEKIAAASWFSINMSS